MIGWKLFKNWFVIILLKGVKTVYFYSHNIYVFPGCAETEAGGYIYELTRNNGFNLGTKTAHAIAIIPSAKALY